MKLTKGVFCITYPVFGGQGGCHYKSANICPGCVAREYYIRKPKEAPISAVQCRKIKILLVADEVL